MIFIKPLPGTFKLDDVSEDKRAKGTKNYCKKKT